MLEFGLAFGLAAVLALGLADWLLWLTTGLEVPERPLAAWLSVMLVFGLPFGLVAGLADALGNSDLADSSTSPQRSYRGNRTHDVIASLAFGLPCVLVLGLTVGLEFGLAVGLAVGLAGRAWFPFVSAALWQAVRGRLPAPWRTMAVLDDAHRLGLLRSVGPAYQFRHAELQDHLVPPSPGPTA